MKSYCKNQICESLISLLNGHIIEDRGMLTIGIDFIDSRNTCTWVESNGHKSCERTFRSERACAFCNNNIKSCRFAHFVFPASSHHPSLTTIWIWFSFVWKWSATCSDNRVACQALNVIVTYYSFALVRIYFYFCFYILEGSHIINLSKLNKLNNHVMI